MGGRADHIFRTFSATIVPLACPVSSAVWTVPGDTLWHARAGADQCACRSNILPPWPEQRRCGAPEKGAHIYRSLIIN